MALKKPPVRISTFPLFALKTAAARPAVTRRSMCSSNLSIYSSAVSSSSNRAFTRALRVRHRGLAQSDDSDGFRVLKVTVALGLSLVVPLATRFPHN